MKKFFIMITAACLFAIGNVFADSWTSNPDPTGYFTLGVYCEPSLSGSDSHELGNYFTGQQSVPVEDASTRVLHWYLTGPPTTLATYVLTGTGHANDLIIGNYSSAVITAEGGIGGNSILSGNFYVPDLTLSTAVSCVTGNHDCEITFTPSTLQTIGTGPQTFSITLSVTITM